MLLLSPLHQQAAVYSLMMILTDNNAVDHISQNMPGKVLVFSSSNHYFGSYSSIGTRRPKNNPGMYSRYVGVAFVQSAFWTLKNTHPAIHAAHADSPRAIFLPR